jgi:hypothetical protein
MALVMAVAACGYDNKGYGSMGPGNGANSQAISASGDLTAKITEFRALLGDSANKIVGEQVTGRREINWDGVTAPRLNVDTFPGDFFNRVLPRGQIFSTPGTGLRVSDNALADVDPAFPAQFSAFSPPKVFLSIGSPIILVDFVVAGTNTPARVTGFGVVFSDVDRAGSTSLEFFDVNGGLLRKVNAPVRSDAAGHSFVGVVFDQPIVASVRIRAGDAAVAAGVQDLSAGGTADLVVTDDFLGGEPHRIN